jgi:hypothetical protein
MTRIILAIFITVFAAPGAFAQAKSAGEHVVTAGTLNVRLAADTNGKLAGKLYRGQKVEVLEVDDGWARISRYFDGASQGLSGSVARWVFAAHLSAESSAQQQARPVEQAPRPVQRKVDPDSPIYLAIKSSDDLAKYRGTFVSVSEKLVDAGTCKLSDFKDIGGWWRSAAHEPAPVYYTYCGGGNNNNRIYVNVDTGSVFR